MSVRVGLLSAAHVHAGGYVHALNADPEADFVGVWDDNEERAREFSRACEVPFYIEIDGFLEKCDAVVIASENVHHGRLAVAAANAGIHILVEKPFAVSEAQAKEMLDAARENNVVLMTAFPCRFSPAYRRLRERVRAGEIGEVRAVCATNRGRCPGGWFTDPALSGGGAMIDHTVHVADLLRDLLQSEPAKVFAQTGNNLHGQAWEDTAKLTVEFENGVFATIDSSWSRPPTFKTWGDVTMNVVGESGVIELDMFGQELQVYGDTTPNHRTAGWGSNLDALMVREFLHAIQEKRTPAVTGDDGWRAAQVALAGYESVRSGQPVALSA